MKKALMILIVFALVLSLAVPGTIQTIVLTIIQGQMENLPELSLYMPQVCKS